mmetsp:Transcript_59336/g.105487  ORF Transcript_59336/g.105487 Transcript_59336/m.105487 type:complete len:228 (+) Transcript_59336:398-1081(+)
MPARTFWRPTLLRPSPGGVGRRPKPPKPPMPWLPPMLGKPPAPRLPRPPPPPPGPPRPPKPPGAASPRPALTSSTAEREGFLRSRAGFLKSSAPLGPSSGPSSVRSRSSSDPELCCFLASLSLCFFLFFFRSRSPSAGSDPFASSSSRLLSFPPPLPRGSALPMTNDCWILIFSRRGSSMFPRLSILLPADWPQCLLSSLRALICRYSAWHLAGLGSVQTLTCLSRL